MTTTETRPTLTLIDVDPATLEANPHNVRTKARDIDDLAASIAKVGVLVPLVVRSNGNGHHVIVAGHRRALAAVKAGVGSVPVIVHDYDDEGQAELTAMMVENLHREDLTAADEAKGFEQLAAFGMSIDEIAKLTGRKTERITTGLQVAKSATSSAVAAKYDLNLEQAAAIAEFDGDRDVVKELTFAAQKAPEKFEHVAQRARQERERLAKVAAQRSKLEAAKVIVLPAGKRFGYDVSAKAGVYLSRLADAKGKHLTVANHKTCPGHAAEISTYGDSVEYGCADPKTHGHKDRYATPRSKGAPAAPKKTAADKEREAAAKAKAEQDAKALEASTVVRRKFVRDLLARKTPPKGLLGFVVPVLLEHEMYPDGAVVVELTGVKSSKQRPDVNGLLLELVRGASEARLQVVLLAFVACSLESDWQPYLLAPASWQSNTAEAKYLQFLVVCGYGLSDVEQRIVDVAFPPAKPARAKKTTSS